MRIIPVSKANQIANYLLKKGVQSEKKVGVMLERSNEMLLAIFGVLKAGGAYLPIHPEFPKKRIEFILSDSKINLLLTTKPIYQALNIDLQGIDILFVDVLSLFDGESTTFNYRSNPQDLAYIIYTSGSTGNPKGVMIEHKPVMNRLNWMQYAYPLNNEDTILQKTPFTFDVSVWELFWWFFNGAKVALLPHNGEKSPEIICKAIDEFKISLIHFVPTLFKAFLEYLETYESVSCISSLKRVFTSGEELPVSQVKKFYELTRGYEIDLVNLYGPTEATVDVSYFNCNQLVVGSKRVPIGKPIHNTRFYVINEENKLLSTGETGELCIAGVGLTRGYLNRDELNREKFTYLPELPGERIYKTGDLVCILPDGNIDFLGRIDHQVKLHGNRIELEEIEARLIKFELINDAVVAIKESESEKHICAYYVSDFELTTYELRNYLAEWLPSYMIPHFFIHISKIPTNMSGKTDRNLLPDPVKEKQRTVNYEEPTTDLEKNIVGIWEK